MSVKCGLLTDKSAKIGSLSVNLSEILADCSKNKKYVPSRHVFLSLFSCVRGHGRLASHLANRVSPHNPLVPSTLARARRAYPSQARLGYAGAERSAPHLVPTKQTVPPLLPKATKPKCLTTANKERFLKPSRFSHDQQCS